jgi:hypothetical protein
MRAIKVKNPKLIRVLAYIWQRMGEPRSPTKLFIMAWHADCENYVRTGKSISGSNWRKSKLFCVEPVDL